MCATVHADPMLSSDCVGSYNPDTRSCGSGEMAAYATLRGAAAAAQPGDVVLLREGTFREALDPPRSGVPGSEITFKSYPGETAVLSGVDAPALFLSNRSHVIVEGLTVRDVLGWGRVESSRHIIIRNNRFSEALARGTTGGLKFVKSAFNRVLGNSFDEGNDSLVLQESDRNLVEGNAFTTARHSLLSIRCGNYNVIRGNRFDNPRQKAAEIYDCEGTSDAPVKLDATKHNVFEYNAFTRTKAAERDHRYNGIQYGGQNGIVRRNVFSGNLGGGLKFQVYAKESLYNNLNRVYHNTFFRNRCYGLSASPGSGFGLYFGNVVKNNLFYANVDCAGRASQTSIGNRKAVRFESNAVLATPPQFADEAGGDLRPTADSPMIDAGAFLTRTRDAGTGTVMTVEDAGYFRDGFGIPDETGDVIQLEGQIATARIVGIDYKRNVLTLDTPLTWEKGQHLHLQYSGRAPDFGAFEFPGPGRSLVETGGLR